MIKQYVAHRAAALRGRAHRATLLRGRPHGATLLRATGLITPLLRVLRATVLRATAPRVTVPRAAVLRAAVLRAAVLLVVSSFLIGCRSSQRITEMNVVGEPEMNNGGNAAVVRVYQLSGDSNFTRASLETFWRNDEEALGAELIGAKQEILLYPEQERAIDLNLSAEARYLGIAADLRAPDPVQWRQIFDAEEVQGRVIHVRVETDRLTVSY